MQNSKKLWRGLSKSFSYAAVFKNVSFSEHSAILTHVRTICQKVSTSDNWKLSKVNLWPEPNMPNYAYTTPGPKLDLLWPHLLELCSVLFYYKTLRIGVCEISGAFFFQKSALLG